MKQPELGQKIASLRKIKGLTQEELCQACNINIRSLQRIENGEVNPRAYTLKLISEQLNYDFWTEVAATQAEQKKSWWDLNFVSAPSDRTMAQHARWGWIGGIIYFLLTIPDVIMGVWRYTDSLDSAASIIYVLVSVGIILSSILFFRAFSSLGRKLNQSILTISSYLIMLLIIVLYGYDLVTLNFHSWSTEAMGIMHLMSLGFAGIFFGIGLARTESTVGNTAKVAAILEIAVGVSFVVIITAFVGLVLIFPAIIAEIVLLHKVQTMFDKSTAELNFAN
ncbi:MAG: helix-turn-helix domain-containing protein [Cyclobacteriaceae bacterium]|nr:helix-turn-helix domain-containing protein [Cyclobacteriaceae bacterium]